MHLHRPSLAFLLLIPSVLGEPIVDGYLNARAALFTPAPRVNEPNACDRYTAALSSCESKQQDLASCLCSRCLCCGDQTNNCSRDYDCFSKCALSSCESKRQDLARCLCSSCLCCDYCCGDQTNYCCYGDQTNNYYCFDDDVSTCFDTVQYSDKPSTKVITPWMNFCHDNYTPNPTPTPPPNWVPDMWDRRASCPTEAAAASSISIASVASESEGLSHSVAPVGHPSASPTPTRTPTPTSSPTPGPNHAGEIAGGVVGGVAGLGLIVWAATIIRKWIAN